MRSFIRVVEVWVPDADGSLLELSDGIFGSAAHFEALTRSMCFGRGEGLPGRAWDEGRPLLLERFEGSYFRRTAAAHAAGLRSAVALPFFHGDRLAAVAVVFCSGSVDDGVGVEVQRDAEAGVPADGDGLVLPCPTAAGGLDLVRFRPPAGTPLAGRIERRAAAGPAADFASVFMTGVPAIAGSTVGLPSWHEGQVAEVLAVSL